MRKYLSLLVLIALQIPAFSQNFLGNWYGILKVPGAKLHLNWHIIRDSIRYLATLDVPDQKAKGLLMDSTLIQGKHIRMVFKTYGIVYEGDLNPDSNKVFGTFSQGQKFPLTLENKPILEIKELRPQDPKTFPYKQEEISFTNPVGKNKLSGTLTLPSSGKFSKILILITGSGPQNRNEELMDHRPFLVWSDFLTRNGMAVLRYDDRGIGKSTGTFAGSTTQDFVDDAEAAVQYILSRPDLKNHPLGLLGHSEGALVATILASKNKDIKFLILLAGPGIPITDLMIQQNEDQSRIRGASPSQIETSKSLNKSIYSLMNQFPNLKAEDLSLKIQPILVETFKKNNPGNILDSKIQEFAKIGAGQYTEPWFRYFIQIQPGEYLEKVKCPVLALNGSLDSQVRADSNLNGIKMNLEKGGNHHFEIVPLVGLNHLLQKAQTGAVSEYEQIAETVNIGALDKVESWLKGLIF